MRSIHEYTAAGVAENLGLSLSEEFERQAVGFVFHHLTKELSPSCANMLESRRVSARATEHEVSKRLHRAKQYMPDFFLGDKFPEKALMLAVICDSYVNHINEPDQDEVGNLIPHFDGFDEDIVLDAVDIWEEAQELSKTGESEKPVREVSMFLAHLMAFDILEDIERNMTEDPDFDDLEEILETDLRPIFAIVRGATHIGDDLWQYAEAVERRIQNILNPPTPAQRGLRLVYDADKPQP